MDKVGEGTGGCPGRRFRQPPLSTAVITFSFGEADGPSFGVPFTWPDLGGKCLQPARAQTTATPGKPSILSPRPGWNLGCLRSVFDLPGLGRGEGGRAPFYLQCPEPPAHLPIGPIREVLSPNQHHANSDRWMYMFGGGRGRWCRSRFDTSLATASSEIPFSKPGPISPFPNLCPRTHALLCPSALCCVPLQPAGREGKGVVTSWASRAWLDFMLWFGWRGQQPAALFPPLPSRPSLPRISLWPPTWD